MSDMNTTQVHSEQLMEDEISLSDIIEFFQENWIFIASFVGLGIVAAIVFINVVPNRYEGTAKIQMAQVVNNNNNNNNNNNVFNLGANVEDPNTLIERMKTPSSYSQEMVKACTDPKSDDPNLELSKLLKITTIKLVPNVVEVKIRLENRQQIETCLNATFQQIATSQKEISMPFFDEAKKRINENQGKLEDAKQIISKADHSGGALSAGYLSTRDDIRYLNEQNDLLSKFINSGELGKTKLVSPPYVTNSIVFPKKGISLIAGTFGGFFIGLMLAILRKTWKSYQNSKLVSTAI